MATVSKLSSPLEQPQRVTRKTRAFRRTAGVVVTVAFGITLMNPNGSSETTVSDTSFVATASSVTVSAPVANPLATTTSTSSESLESLSAEDRANFTDWRAAAMPLARDAAAVIAPKFFTYDTRNSITEWVGQFRSANSALADSLMDANKNFWAQQRAQNVVSKATNSQNQPQITAFKYVTGEATVLVTVTQTVTSSELSEPSTTDRQVYVSLKNTGSYASPKWQVAGFSVAK